MTSADETIDALWPDGGFTPTERTLLAFLLAADEPVPREVLLQEVWGYSPKSRSNTVESTMTRLRRKIEEDPSRPTVLRTLRGLGYLLVPPERERPAPPSRDEIARRLTEWLGEGHDWVVYVRSERSTTNLKPESTRFIGRTDDMATVGALLDEGARLVTLHGPGGVGKTRLARELARAHADNFPGGTWFCDLSDASGPADALGVVADVLGVVRSTGIDGLLLGLAGVLRRQGPTLIVLDNLEHLVETAREPIARVLTLVPQLTVIATSREALRIAEEHRYDLDPLPREDAVTLLRSRLAGTLDDDAEEAQTAMLGDIAEVLEGIPLALEMAAARARLLPLAELSARLHTSFDILRGTDGVPDRQRTLERSIDWSWQMLTPDERAALIQLAVFRGGCALEVAERVMQTQADTLSVLGSLVDKSMLRRRRGRHRLALFEPVRAFALARAGKAAAVARTRHAEWVLQASREWAERCDDDPDASNALMREADNIAEAQRWLSRIGDPRAVLLLRSCWTTFSRGRTPAELTAMARDTRVRVRPSGDDEAWVQGVLGAALTLSYDIDAARVELDRGLERSTGEQLVRAFLLLYRSVIARWTGDSALAMQLADEGAAIARKHDAVGLQLRLENERWSANKGAPLNAQVTSYQDAIERADRHGAAALLGGLWSNLAGLHSEAGQQDRALEALEHAHAACLRFDDNLGLMQVESTRARILARMGRLAESDALYTRILRQRDRMGDRSPPGMTRLNAAITAWRLGDLPRARSLLEQATQEIREGGDRSHLFTHVVTFTLLVTSAAGDLRAAETHARTLDTLEPGDPALNELARAFLDLLRARSGPDKAASRASAAARLDRLQGMDAPDDEHEILALQRALDGLPPERER